jgi:hypothetical protein
MPGEEIRTLKGHAGTVFGVGEYPELGHLSRLGIFGRQADQYLVEV